MSRGGRLPDPGLGALCGRCGEPREAHGGPKHLGACPDEHGLYARRFSIADEDRAEREPLRVAYDLSVMFPGLDRATATERLREALESARVPTPGES